jgi:diaminopimelate decarboxylase
MDDRLNSVKAEIALLAVKQGLLEPTGSVSVIDVAGLVDTVGKLRAAFPSHFLHAFAVKANFYPGVLSRLATAGLGAEVAGPGELALARAAGFSTQRIVFDAPVKTEKEIAEAIDLGLAYNIDNFQEFEKVIAIVKRAETPRGPVGFRLNPQIGAGTVAQTSTATDTSKFGVGLADEGVRVRLINAYTDHDWLTSIHVHVGSIGCPLSLMAQGVREAVKLAGEIDAACGGKRIEIINIGGGLPVNFASDSDEPSFAKYAEVLRREVPELFTGQFQVATEFGRAIIAKNALTVARVEYTKRTGGRHIALTHAGAHNMIRVVFQPEVWARRVTALDAEGAPKTGARVIQDIAGPCCFAGDIIAHERSLPLLEPGDHVLIHDTGAYCFANHYLYNAMPPDPVWALEKSAQKLTLISSGQNTAELIEALS